MTQPSALIAIGQVVVGSGMDASAAYFATQCVAREATSGPEDLSTTNYRERTWTISCLAFAATPADRQALRQTLLTTLVGRGRTVTFTEAGGARTLAAADALPGYPLVSLGETQQTSYGGVVGFDLTCTTREPIEQADGLVEHDVQTSFEAGPTGGSAMRATGRVRVLASFSGGAKQWIADEVFDAARTAAAAAGESFTTRVSTRNDPTYAEYEYTRSSKAADLGSGIVSADLDDTLSTTTTRAARRVISGRAEGFNAAAYAEAAEPTLDATDVLVSSRVSAPSVPTGRVSFAYEVERGKVVSGFGASVLYSFDESLDHTPAATLLGSATFLTGAPVLYRAGSTPAAYVQRTTVEYTGSRADVLTACSALLAVANLVRPVRPVDGPSRGPIKRLTLTREYLFAADVDPLPAPRSVDFSS